MGLIFGYLGNKDKEKLTLSIAHLRGKSLMWNSLN